ncbi:EMILIN-2 [Clupea harengus]|uniref:EMILIN-2 n=1 Tax=Clupea harengus TaxID=7950 RepID=A0A8M1KX53_CLUHA|nr:EMILIN-2 [Clupea harengus]
MYKIGYKQVTELEWKCCPGYQGFDCMELKDFPPAPRELHPNLAHSPRQEQSMLGPEKLESLAREQWGQAEILPPWGDSGQRGTQPSHPWLQGGGGSGRDPADNRKVWQLEDEVQRLSQNLLELQAAMTGMNANLRQDLQEDASKIFLSMLGGLRQPASALGGGTESIVLPAVTPDPLSASLTEQLQFQVHDLSDTLASNTLALRELQGQVQQQDGRLRPLTDAAQGALRDCCAAPNSTNQGSLKDYVDSKISALRTELMEGMDIKMADLKNSCEYKVTSLREECEDQETNYFSLAELLDSKEADLRKEIQELRLSVGGGPGTGSSSGAEDGQPNARLTKIEEAQRELLATLERQNNTLRKMEESGAELEGRVGLAERSAEVHCLFLEEKLRREKEKERQEEAEERRKALGNSSTLEELKRELNTHQHLIHSLEGALNATQEKGEKQAQLCCGEAQSLTRRVKGLESSVSGLNDSVSQSSRELQQLNATCRHADSAGPARESLAQRLTTLEDAWPRVDGRVSSVEGVCGRLGPLSDSLGRIKEGLSKHVTGLWTCVKQMNGTLRAHTRDLHDLYEHTHTLQNKAEQTTNTPVHSVLFDQQQLQPSCGPLTEGPPLSSQSPRKGTV